MSTSTSADTASSSIMHTSVGSISIGWGLGFIMASITVVFFMIKYKFLPDRLTTFNALVFLGIPVIGFIFTLLQNFFNQYMITNKINIAKSALGALCVFIGILFTLGISHIPYLRVPIVTIMVPLANIVVDKPTTGEAASSTCCTPHTMLETAESKDPTVSGVARGFWVFFGVLMGRAFNDSIIV
jgi:hypothetical protein